ncbi:hypothetical protein HMPREF3153_04860 [Corynebacterium sp. HMSC06C06]|nr:hypothetical protein WU85_11150 [Corynebacterium striatum]OFT52676.1 hypothetical protein HMPREF3153_04860 [Corynebacterium sp. HMSC06C06]
MAKSWGVALEAHEMRKKSQNLQPTVSNLRFTGSKFVRHAVGTTYCVRQQPMMKVSFGSAVEAGKLHLFKKIRP